MGRPDNTAQTLKGRRKQRRELEEEVESREAFEKNMR